LPKVPTFAEAGFPGLEIYSSFSVAAPSGTPAAIVQRMSAEIMRAMKSPGLAGKLEHETLIPVFDTPELFAAHLKKERAAWEAVARAAPDGYTLTLGSTGPSAVNPALYAKLPFDLVRDLDIVSLVATGNSALAVHPGVPATNVRELVALAKAQPGKLTYASSGNGSSLHLAAEL